MKNQLKNTYHEILTELDSPEIQKEFNSQSFQIDFINTEITSKSEVVRVLNENSNRLQHLIDVEPRLIRWWFDDLRTATKVLSTIIKEHNVLNLSFRLICQEKNLLFIQNGDL